MENRRRASVETSWVYFCIPVNWTYGGPASKEGRTYLYLRTSVTNVGT